MKSFLLSAIILLFSAMAFAAGGTLRDGSGNLKETWRQQGSRIEVRDGSGNLIREISPHNSSSNGHYNIRDSSGNLIGEFQRGNDD